SPMNCTANTTAGRYPALPKGFDFVASLQTALRVLCLAGFASPDAASLDAWSASPVSFCIEVASLQTAYRFSSLAGVISPDAAGLDAQVGLALNPDAFLLHSLAAVCALLQQRAGIVGVRPFRGQLQIFLQGRGSVAGFFKTVALGSVAIQG